MTPNVAETADRISIETSAIRAEIVKRGYVSGVAGGSFVDKKSGFHDAGFGLDIVDWIMEPGSDEAYRDKLTGDLKYEFNNPFHGSIPKRSIEGPQICTQAKELHPEVIRGRDFVAIKQRFRYTDVAPGHKPGSEWEQTLVFPQGKRYFLSCDRITAVNSSEAMFLRLDMPGHIKHNGSDTFSEVYLSYAGRIPASEFDNDFPPDAKFLYRRGGKTPARFIRAYHLRDPKTGKDGPWLTGMTLDPAVVHEAWCHQRGYVCMIEEFGGRPIKPGQSFSAAFLVGYFDSIDEMNRTYDQFAGYNRLIATDKNWKLGVTVRRGVIVPAGNARHFDGAHRPAIARDMARMTESAPQRTPDVQNPAHVDQRIGKRLEWFQDQKFGLFVHWGVYSQWGCIESWPLVEEDKWARPDGLPAWVERGKDMDRFRRDYWALNRTFNPQHFDPEKWAQAAKRAGMKYFVFTTKHHDGFSMFDTKQTDWRITSSDCPFSTNPNANVAKVLFDTFRRQGFGIGAYFSKADWHHPDYWSHDTPARTRNPNFDTLVNPAKWARFVDFTHNQIEELMTGYGPIDILWLDAGQVRPPRQDIQMDRLVQMARGHQPKLIVVDRTVGGPHENYRTPEQEVPEKPLPYVWETCMTMGDQWSYKPNDAYKSTNRLVHLLVDIVAKGGNFLLNIGPDSDGQLPPAAVQRLTEMGDWLRINGEAIYGTRPVPPYKQGKIAFTRKGHFLYAIYLLDEGERMPGQIRLTGIRLRPGPSIRLLGRHGRFSWHDDGEGITIDLAKAVSPSVHAFALELGTVD